MDIQAAQAKVKDAQLALSKSAQRLQTLQSQKTENEAVKKEFDNLNSENKVYKLLGPILIQQDHSEARHNVEKRLEFINGDIDRVEANIKKEEQALDEARSALVQLQIAKQQEAHAASA